MDSQTITGGTIGPGASFGDGNVFEGVTIIAPSTFGAGNSFINVTWECLRRCKRGPCGCCGDVSTVGPGGTFVNNSGDHVTIDPTGVTTNFVDGGCTLLTLPDCNDCGSTTIGGAVSTTGSEVVVSDRGTLTYAQWCAKCGRAGVLWDAADVDVAPKK